MDEVKGMAGIMGQSKRDVMTYFKDFIEDYNTATMPHEKYYNYEFWEMNEYKKAQLNKVNKTGVLKESFNDEEERFAEMKKQRIKAEQKEFADTKARLASNKLKMESMAKQSTMNSEMLNAYKIGDTATQKRLEGKLAPVIEKGEKHPWA
mmetsp:Transcript_7790/g.7866  ORF Transcript_7790/g.7866 Transcript_7790/m.7866 type:complete len:150 (+) Transcript_7790:156-605(+)